MVQYDAFATLDLDNTEIHVRPYRLSDRELIHLNEVKVWEQHIVPMAFEEQRVWPVARGGGGGGGRGGGGRGRGRGRAGRGVGRGLPGGVPAPADAPLAVRDAAEDSGAEGSGGDGEGGGGGGESCDERSEGVGSEVDPVAAERLACDLLIGDDLQARRDCPFRSGAAVAPICTKDAFAGVSHA